MNVCPNCSYHGVERACPRDGFPLMNEEVFGRSAGEPDLAGKVFDGRYHVEEPIGHGGMGSVWKARHLTMQNEVALKIMRRELSRDMSAVRRFYQEARASAQLRHPNTIRVHDFGASEEGLLYLAMEYLKGEPLADMVRRQGPLTPAAAVAIARQVCGALDEAHDHGMVHRDLKPDNIFLTQVHRMEGFVKVLDFGIAKVLDTRAGVESLTSTGLVVGTPKYVSPEQAQARLVDRRSDLYSLGVILYEMLTGRVPFEAPSAAGLLVQHVSEPPPPLPGAVGGVPVPHGLRVLVAELLNKRPDDRPKTAAEVERRLAAIAPQCAEGGEGTPTRTLVDGGATIVTPRPASFGVDEGPELSALGRTDTDRRGAAVDEPWPPVRRTGRWALAAAVVVAVVGAGVGLVVLREERAELMSSPEAVERPVAAAERHPAWGEAAVAVRKAPEALPLATVEPAPRARPAEKAAPRWAGARGPESTSEVLASDQGGKDESKPPKNRPKRHERPEPKQKEPAKSLSKGYEIDYGL